MQLSNASATVNCPLGAQNLNLLGSSAALNGSGAVTVSNILNWTGGSMSGSGSTIIAPGGTLNIANPTSLSFGRTLENGGTALWTGAGGFAGSAAVITNRAGAVFEVQNNGTFS
jgi:hypothetical protein